MVTPANIRAGAAAIAVLLEDDQFKKDWKNLQSSVGKITGVLNRVGAAAAAFGGAVSFAFLRMSLAAADAETGFRRFALIFGDNAELMRTRLEALSSETGIAMTTLIRQSSAFGAVFSELGEQLGPEQFVATVAKAQKATIDLAGIAGISMEEAADRIKSALTSTGESVDQYGFNLRQAEINQELMRMGINKNVRQLTELEKQLVKIQLIQKAVERGQLDFTNMTGTLNAKLAQLRSNIEELVIAMTKLLMPILKVVVDTLNVLVRIATWGPFKILTGGLGLLLASLAALTFVLGGVLLLFNGLISLIVWTVNSIGAVNAGIAAMGGGMALLNGVVLSLAAGFAILAESIAAAATAMWAFIAAAWPLIIIGAAIALAVLGLAYAFSRLNSAVGGGKVGTLEVLGMGTGVGGRGTGFRDTMLGLIPGISALRKFRKFQRKATGRDDGSLTGAPSGMGVATGIMGTRMIAQQTAFAAGVTSPEEATASNTGQLVKIARQVLSGEESVSTEARS